MKELNIDESELSNRINRSDIGFYEDFFNTYYKRIYNIAYKMTGHKEDAEDILQEVLYDAFRNIRNFRGESKISTWLYVITKNACLKRLQKSSKNSWLNLENLIHSAAISNDRAEFNDTEKQFYISQVKEGCLLGLIKCLSFYQRISFILNVLFEINTDEVALIIGKTENETRILIHRAKQNIKKFLCQNCSLYEPKNFCQCESLIRFSLKKEWIKKYKDQTSSIYPTLSQVENDLKELKRVLHLYKNLYEHCPSMDFVQHIKNEIRNGNYLVFFSKK